MKIYPAIDLKDGVCVRLTKGNFDESIVYEQDPVKQAGRFAEAGAEWLHLVDLDGAKEARLTHVPLIADIIKSCGLKTQVGGGVRTEEDIETLLDAGATRVIVGSVAAKTPDVVLGWLDKFGGDKVMLALDVRLSGSGIPEVLTMGWQQGSAQSLWNLLDIYRGSSLKTLLCTDIHRDGMLGGTNVELYIKIRQIWAMMEVIASGGVTTMDDLAALEEQGISGAIIGKALYEGRLTLQEVLARYKRS